MGAMFNLASIVFLLLMLALYPAATVSILILTLMVVWLFRPKPGSMPSASSVPPARPEVRTADGRFPLLNEDWVGEVVLAIGDPEVPEVVRRHGARFRNPARYVIDLGGGEYLLYGGDGELLDLCFLR